MAQESTSIQFEDIPLDQARQMGRGPRMDPVLYRTLREKIQSLDNTAARMLLPAGATPAAMKNRILRVAAEINVPVTIRKVPGGLLFWRSTEEDRQQAQETASRLQTAQRGRQQQTAKRAQARPQGRRRRA
jgi:hypothetical protein